METADLNGGNAEVACESSNLETVEEQIEKQSEGEKPEETNEIEQEINGDTTDLSKSVTSPTRRTLRKTKANSTSNVEAVVESDAKPKMKGCKRKLSDPEMNSEESLDFTGFDSRYFDNSDTGNLVLQKLIAEVELTVGTKAKRGRPSRKSIAIDSKQDDILNDVREIMSAKEPEPMDVVNNIESDVPQPKFEETLSKSSVSTVNNSTPNVSAKSKANRPLTAITPSTPVGKPKVDLSNPAFLEPFKSGWKRELVHRGAGSEANLKKVADIYYITPQGKKIRSYKEISGHLTASDNLTVENFTFHKDTLGLNDPEKEIVRTARRGGPKDATPVGKTAVKKVAASPAAVTVAKKTPAKKAENLPAQVSTPVVAKSSPAKSVGRPPKNTPASQKIKPVKKTPLKKTKQKQLDQKQSSPAPVTESKENEFSPAISSPATKRNQQAIEKTVSPKAKRPLKAKVLEPCSLRCSTSMGQIPSLQCSVCLCLYHPECVHVVEYAGCDYVCENCRQDTDETAMQQQTQNSTLTPPPLIPISMIGTSNIKAKHSGNIAPPKLQRIPKSDGTDAHLRIISKHLKSGPCQTAVALPPPPTPTPPPASHSIAQSTEKKEAAWFNKNDNDFRLNSYDGSVPKPAQNIATMAGKRYIIIPKNNSMAVQPAITVKQDKLTDKTPALPINSSTDNTVSKEETTQIKELTPIVEQKEKTIIDNEGPSETSMEIFSDNQKENVNEDLVEDLKNISHEISKDVQETGEAGKEFSTPMEIESNEMNFPVEASDNGKLSEIVNLGRKKLKKAVGKNRRGVRSKYLSNGTTQKLVDERASSGILNIARAGLKRKQVQAETEQRQNFMVSVCAGYHALSKVFQYLKVQELLRVGRVCKMWRDLAAHPSLWKTVRMKNSQVTDWNGFAETLKKSGTQYLDLRKMIASGESEAMWRNFAAVIPRVNSLVKLEFCRCTEIGVEEVIKNCSQLEVLIALMIKCETLNLESLGNLKRCRELRLKSLGGMYLQDDLSSIKECTHLTYLSLTTIKDLGQKKLDALQFLVNLETLELGDCTDFPETFGKEALVKLNKLERLRLEKGQGSCSTFDILDGASKIESLSQLELVNFDVKNGFDKFLAKCTNIKRLLIIPTYISQSATTNNMVLAGVIELSQNLTHFVWGVTLELLRVTELFVDQCNQMNKTVSGDSIPVLKPVPCLKLIQDNVDDADSKKEDDNKQASGSNPQVDILPMSQLQKLLLTALPKTRVKILKIPFNATWRQNISDTISQ
ncbi:uncharacterized protein LOC122498306 isoform X3 [Leptopilina heterotoma]|uniref:uncharacterized protein LOC122498306 isoform X3 n=1 Tax=Leptopilina heterotoma TaxID=63436 RepID=UPI001CA9A804|nr:uncharacterized protein LOC122498306 isoform X3 [Leptopilina heterotoma]